LKREREAIPWRHGKFDQRLDSEVDVREIRERRDK
jgi:hypothetical protein